jgi:hypothetical protein
MTCWHALSVCYRKNPFHCLEHACHVAMLITKMLSRIANPKQVIMEQQQQQQEKGKSFQVASEISDFTFGITSDPLTQFAAFIAALIHDAGRFFEHKTFLFLGSGPLGFNSLFHLS